MVGFWFALTLVEAWVAYAIYSRTHSSTLKELGAIAICAWGVLLLYLDDAKSQRMKIAEEIDVVSVAFEAHINTETPQSANRRLQDLRRTYQAWEFTSLSVLLHLAMIGWGVYLYYRT